VTAYYIFDICIPKGLSKTLGFLTSDVFELPDCPCSFFFFFMFHYPFYGDIQKVPLPSDMGHGVVVMHMGRGRGEDVAKTVLCLGRGRSCKKCV
jgi:hypothetical protein